MSLYGVTKGTELEKEVDQFIEGEARGAGMYQGLARIAKEKGFDEIAAVLLKLADDEARHAGLYAILNGRVPTDLLAVLGQVAQIETDAVEKIKGMANKARMLGLEQAAREIEAAAEDEGRHGEILKNLVNKHQK